MRAQAAFEYMLVVIIVLAFMIPIWTYIVTVNNEANDELSLSYAKNTVDAIASAADLVYTQGPPAKVRISVSIPGGVQGYNITNNTVMLEVGHGGAASDIYAISRARLNGTLPVNGGTYLIEVSAIEDANYDVNIRRAA